MCRRKYAYSPKAVRMLTARSTKKLSVEPNNGNPLSDALMLWRRLLNMIIAFHFLDLNQVCQSTFIGD